VATYKELVREIADDTDATLVDFWRMREYRDSRLWDVDRIHLSALGHRHMAVAAHGGRRARRPRHAARGTAHRAVIGDGVQPRYPAMDPDGNGGRRGSGSI
jgi:hypothetical protein